MGGHRFTRPDPECARAQAGTPGVARRRWCRGCEAVTSTHSKYYTGLKFRSKKHFHGCVAPEGILELHTETDLFTAAERPKRFLVSKCTFTALFRALSRIIFWNCTCTRRVRACHQPCIYIFSYDPSYGRREKQWTQSGICLLYTSPSPREGLLSRMPSSA